MDEIEVDKLRNLPESLLFQILLKLPTKDVVKTSLLSTKWRNLWRYVPGLELNRSDFSDSNDLVSFVDKFLMSNVMQSFKYCNENAEKADVAHDWHYDTIEIPSTLFTCESLISLTLSDLDLPCPDFVALPSLKVSIADSLVLEKLLSNSPVLESLSIRYSWNWDMEVLLVRSHSLLSFVYAENNCVGVEIDAPRLEYLSLYGNESDIIILNNSASLVKVDINAKVGKLLDSKRNMFGKFLLGISSVKDMSISSSTLEVLFDYSVWGSLPLFRNLSFLRVAFGFFGVELLPFFLKSCPNLKSLFVRFETYFEFEMGTYDIVHGSWGLLASSLEYVEIEKPYKGKKMMMELVCYLKYF